MKRKVKKKIFSVNWIYLLCWALMFRTSRNSFDFHSTRICHLPETNAISSGISLSLWRANLNCSMRRDLIHRLGVKFWRMRMIMAIKYKGRAKVWKITTHTNQSEMRKRNRKHCSKSQLEPNYYWFSWKPHFLTFVVLWLFLVLCMIII